MFFPLGAMLSGDPTRSFQQTANTALDYQGMEAAGKAVQMLAGGTPPTAQTMPNVPGGQPAQAGGLFSGSGPFAAVGRLLGMGQNPTLGMPPGGSPPPGPQSGAPGAPAAPAQATMSPMGQGGAAGGGALTWQQIVQGVTQSNPGMRDPAVIMAAVNKLTPLMQASSLDQWRMMQAQMRSQGLGMQADRIAEQDYGHQLQAYTMGVQSGIIDPTVTPPPQPPQLRSRGTQAPAPGSPGQYPPQQAQRPAQRVPPTPPPASAPQSEATDPMTIARNRLSAGMPQLPPGAAASLEPGPDQLQTTERPQITVTKRPPPADAKPTAQAETGVTPVTPQEQAMPAGRAAAAIMSGKQPPDLTGTGRERNTIQQVLNKHNFDLAQARLEWEGAKRQTQTMHGPQMTRFFGVLNASVNTIGEVRRLANEMKQGNISFANKAALEYEAKFRGNTPKGQLATKYLAAIAAVKDELAAVVQGGYTPSGSAFKLAQQMVNENFGMKQMNAALDELQPILEYRRNALSNLGGAMGGPGSPNPYLGTGGQGQQPPVQGQQPAGQEPVAIDPRTGRKAIYRDGQWQIQPAQ